MKIIISHDVDHLYPMEHICHDLIIPKLWVRSLVHLVQAKISIKTFLCRLGYPFYKRYNRLAEIMKKDKENRIPSTFFFGMEKGLGMSYGKAAAAKAIAYVRSRGFDVGVHGIDFTDICRMKAEKKSFEEIAQIGQFGIRMHYVRYDSKTFKKLSQIGYRFDTSEFDKSGQEFKAPYKVGDMWEFPLHIMDGYIMPEGNLEKGMKNTKSAMKKAEQAGIPYCCILFHDSFYNPYTYPKEKQYYDWLVGYIKEQKYECISYKEALEELEGRHG